MIFCVPFLMSKAAPKILSTCSNIRITAYIPERIMSINRSKRHQCLPTSHSHVVMVVVVVSVKVILHTVVSIDKVIVVSVKVITSIVVIDPLLRVVVACTATIPIFIHVLDVNVM